MITANSINELMRIKVFDTRVVYLIELRRSVIIFIAHKCFSRRENRKTVIAILRSLFCFRLIAHARNYVYRRQKYFANCSHQRRSYGIYCPRNERLVSFVLGNLRTYFSAISLITSRHGSFICIIRTNIHCGFARSTNVSVYTCRTYISRTSYLIFAIVSSR